MFTTFKIALVSFWLRERVNIMKRFKLQHDILLPSSGGVRYYVTAVYNDFYSVTDSILREGHEYLIIFLHSV